MVDASNYHERVLTLTAEVVIRSILTQTEPTKRKGHKLNTAFSDSADRLRDVKFLT